MVKKWISFKIFSPWLKWNWKGSFFLEGFKGFWVNLEMYVMSVMVCDGNNHCFTKKNKKWVVNQKKRILEKSMLLLDYIQSLMIELNAIIRNRLWFSVEWENFRKRWKKSYQNWMWWKFYSMSRFKLIFFEIGQFYAWKKDGIRHKIPRGNNLADFVNENIQRRRIQNKPLKCEVKWKWMYWNCGFDIFLK